MAGYVPGEQLNDPDIVKLNTNENPYPPSPRVFDAIRAALTSNSLRKYPQPLGDRFREAASGVLGVSPDSILIGNGSDDILTILTRVRARRRADRVADTELHPLQEPRGDSAPASRRCRMKQIGSPTWRLGRKAAPLVSPESEFAYRDGD